MAAMADPASRRALLGVPSDVFATWHDPHAEDLAYASLAAAYGVVALVALAQLARIHARVPEYGWTTQKTFHALHFLCATTRALVFLLRDEIDEASVKANENDTVDKNVWTVLRSVAFDLPCLLFFTTYALLVLFWAEMYYTAKGKRGDQSPRRVFYVVNLVAYVTLGTLWIAGGIVERTSLRTTRILETCAAVLISVCALGIALLFAKYGGSLFLMLRRFPESAKGRRQKLREIGVVTFVCVLCFAARAAAIFAEAVFLSESDTKQKGGKNHQAGGFLDAVHPLTPAVDIAYYAICELFPAATALFVLRKLPPKAATRDEAPRRGDENA